MNDDTILMPPVERTDSSPAEAEAAKRIVREKKPHTDTAPSRTRRPTNRRRSVRRAILVVATVLVFAVGWIAVRGGLAVAAAAEGAGGATRLGALLTNQNAPAARTEVELIESKAREVRDLTSDPIWRAAELVPVLGSNLITVREAAAALDVVAAEALTPVVDLASAVSFSGIESRGRDDRLADLALAAGPLAEISTALTKASQGLADVDPASNVAPLADGFTDVKKTIRFYASAATGLEALSRMVPTLGVPGPGEPWTITVTVSDDEGVAKPVAYLKASASDHKFSVSEIIDAGSGKLPEAGAQTINVDAALLEVLTNELGTMTVPGVGDISPDAVADFVSRGAYNQAPSVADAEKWIGAFAATAIGRALN